MATRPSVPLTEAEQILLTADDARRIATDALILANDQQQNTAATKAAEADARNRRRRIRTQNAESHKNRRQNCARPKLNEQPPQPEKANQRQAKARHKLKRRIKKPTSRVRRRSCTKKPQKSASGIATNERQTIEGLEGRCHRLCGGS